MIFVLSLIKKEKLRILQFEWSSCVKKAKPNTVSLFKEVWGSMNSPFLRKIRIYSLY